VTTHTARPISFHIDGIEVGTGKLWESVVVDCMIAWSKYPRVDRDVNYRIESAIRRGHDAIAFVNDGGERAAVTWEIEK
jgi:hypothetical protein